MKKIVIIGASYLQLPLVEKAKEMGLETHVFSWEDGAVAKEIADFFYPISILEKELILAECKKIKPDGIVSIASDLAMVTVNYIAHELNLIGNTIKCTENTTNKYLMRQQFALNNLKYPKFCKVSSKDNYIIDGFKFPLIIKPTDRSGSRGVTKIISEQEIASAIETALSFSLNNEAIIEEFIEGDEVSVETISYEGKHYFLTITDKETTGEPNFIETAHHQPSKYLFSMKLEIQNLTFLSLDSLGIKNGASHTEIKITSDGTLYVIEVGARMGGDFIGSDLVRLSTGYDFVKGVIDVSLGIFEEPVFIESNYSGVHFVYPNNNGIVHEIIDKTSEEKSIIKKNIKIKIGDKVNKITESADRLGYYMYKNSKKIEGKELINLIIK